MCALPKQRSRRGEGSCFEDTTPGTGGECFTGAEKRDAAMAYQFEKEEKNGNYIDNSLTGKRDRGVLMGIRLGKIPLNVFISVKRIITDAPETAFDVLCNVCFAGFNKSSVGNDGSAIRAGHNAVIGKIILTGDSLGHPQIIATALDAARSRFNSANLGCVFHDGSLFLSQ